MKNKLRNALNNFSYFIGLERFGSLLTKRIFWRANTKRKVIALTFDDGPHPIFTPQILEILAENRVRASFFLIGSNVVSQPDLARQIINTGHQIGNHTFTHPMLTQLKNDQIELEILKTKETIENICGLTTTLLRPPYGVFNNRILDIIDRTDHKAVIGDVYPRDTTLPGTQKIITRILRRVRNGSVIIMHDGVTFVGTQTVESIRELIPLLKGNGFQFVGLKELMDFHLS